MPRFQNDTRFARAILSAPYPLPLTVTDRNDDISLSPSPEPEPGPHLRAIHPPPPAPLPLPPQPQGAVKYRNIFPIFPFPNNSSSSSLSSSVIAAPAQGSMALIIRGPEDEPMMGIEETQRGQAAASARATQLRDGLLHGAYTVRIVRPPVPPSTPQPIQAQLAALPPAPNSAPPSNSPLPNATPAQGSYPLPSPQRQPLPPRPASPPSVSGYTSSSLPEVCSDSEGDADADSESLYQATNDSVSGFSTSTITNSKGKRSKTKRPLRRMFIGETGLTPFTYAPTIPASRRRASPSTASTSFNGFVSEAESTRTITRVPRGPLIRSRRNEMRPRELTYRSPRDSRRNERSVTPKARPPALARANPPPAPVATSRDPRKVSSGAGGNNSALNATSHHNNGISGSHSHGVDSHSVNNLSNPLFGGLGNHSFKGKERAAQDEVISEGQKTPTQPRFEQPSPWPTPHPRTPTPMPMSLDPEEFSWPRPLDPRESEPLALSLLAPGGVGITPAPGYSFPPSLVYSFAPLHVPAPVYSFPTGTTPSNSDAISTDPADEDLDGDLDVDITTSAADIASFTGGFDSGFNVDPDPVRAWHPPSLDRVERVELPIAKACHNFLLARQMQEARRRHLARAHAKRVRDAPGLPSLERVVHGMTAAADAVAMGREPAPFRPVPTKHRNQAAPVASPPRQGIQATPHQQTRGEASASRGSGVSVWPTPPTPPRHTIAIRSLASIAHVDESKPPRKRRRSLSPSSAYDVVPHDMRYAEAPGGDGRDINTWTNNVFQSEQRHGHGNSHDHGHVHGHHGHRRSHSDQQRQTETVQRVASPKALLPPAPIVVRGRTGENGGAGGGGGNRGLLGYADALELAQRIGEGLQRGESGRNREGIGRR